MKTAGRRSAELMTSLWDLNRPVFRLKDVSDITGLGPASARSLARKLVDRGLATRVKSGMFVLMPSEMGSLSTYVGDPLLVAREIVGATPYYLSHSTAMELHRMLTQPQLGVTMVLPEWRRPVTVGGTEYRFAHYPKDQWFGIATRWSGSQQLRVSDPERTILDGLRSPQFAGGMTEVAKGLWMRRDAISIDRLVEYATRLDIASVAARAGYLLELYELATPDQLAILRALLSESYRPLDPILPSEGRHLSSWKLQLNVTADELLAQRTV